MDTGLGSTHGVEEDVEVLEPDGSANPAPLPPPPGQAGSRTPDAHGGGAEPTALELFHILARRVPLLTAEQEIALGREIVEAREAMVESLARIPAAVGAFVEAVRHARDRQTPLTHVLFAPFESTRADAGQRPLQLASDLAQAYAHWRTAHARGVATAAQWVEVTRLFVTVDPAYPALCECLASCERLERRVARAKRELARCAERGGECDDARRTLESARAEAGTAPGALRAECRRAREAARRYREARRHMVEANLRLAYGMARRFPAHGVSPEDVLQAANIGLIRAADRFDYRLGYRFSTYASRWIWQAITRVLAEDGRTIRLAAHMHDTVLRLNKVGRRLAQELGRDPTPPELAAASRVPEAKVRRALRSAQATVSLDAPLPESEERVLQFALQDRAQPDPMEEAQDAQVGSHVAHLLGSLPEREALVLRLRHGFEGVEPMTLEQIGAVLGITRERTRQLEVRALTRLRARANPDLAAALGG